MKNRQNPEVQSLVSAPTWSPLEKLRGCLTNLRGNLEGWEKFLGRKKTRRLKKEENCVHQDNCSDEHEYSQLGCIRA